MLEDHFYEKDIYNLNDCSATCVHPATGSASLLDLSICALCLVLWKIQEVLCRTDHFLVILTSNTVEEEAAPYRWNFSKVDWLSFHT